MRIWYQCSVCDALFQRPERAERCECAHTREELEEVIRAVATVFAAVERDLPNIEIVVKPVSEEEGATFVATVTWPNINRVAHIRTVAHGLTETEALRALALLLRLQQQRGY